MRDESGLLVSGSGCSTAELGWDDATTELAAASRSSSCRSPTDASICAWGSRTRRGSAYHWLDDALAFVVYPAGEERGVVRLEGRWTGEEIGVPTEKVAT